MSGVVSSICSTLASGVTSDSPTDEEIKSACYSVANTHNTQLVQVLYIAIFSYIFIYIARTVWVGSAHRQQHCSQSCSKPELHPDFRSVSASRQ